MELNSGTYYNAGAYLFTLNTVVNDLNNLDLQADWNVTYTLADEQYVDTTQTVQLVVELRDNLDNIVATMYGSHAGRSLTRTAVGSRTVAVPSGSYRMVSRIVNLNGMPGASIVGDLIAVVQPEWDWFAKGFHKRIPTSRELTWAEGDENLDITDGRTVANKAAIATLLAKMSPFLDDFFALAAASDPTKTVVMNLSELDPDMNITLVMPRSSGRVVVDGTTQATTFNNNVVIYGDLIQHGATVETEVETLKVTDQVVILRDGATVALPAGEFAGFWIEHYDSEGNRGGMVIDADGVLRIGDDNDLQPVATREETPVAAGVAFWNPTSMRWETSTNFKYDGTRFIVARTTTALTPSSVVAINWDTFAVNTLTLTTDTTLTMSGSYYTGQAMYILVSGDYLLKVDAANFEGDVLQDNVVPNYFGNRKNLVQLFCVDSAQNKFWIIVKATENVS